MVSNLSISCMGISFLVSLLLPIILMIILNKKYNGSLKVFFLGMLTYFISTQIIQAPILKIFVNTDGAVSKFINENALVYSIFTALVAAIIQLAARFIYFKYVCRNNTFIVDSVGFAIGFGGFESIFIGSIVAFNALSYAILINSGNLESSLKSANISSEQILQTLEYYTSTSWQTWTMIGIERIFLMLLQISLSLMVFYAIKYQKNNYLLLSALFQIIVNIPAGLYSMEVIKNIFIAEGLTAILSIIIFIIVIDLTKNELSIFKPIKHEKKSNKKIRIKTLKAK